MFKFLTALLAVIALTAGCGGGAAKSDRAQIQDTARAFIGALVDEDYAKACSFTSDRKQCLGDLATASAFLGKNGSWQSLFPSGLEARMEKAKITIHGSTAVMTPWSATAAKSSDPTNFE